MSFGRCLLAARPARAAARPELERRAQAVAAWLAPLGVRAVDLRWCDDEPLLWGAIDLVDAERPPGALRWGEGDGREAWGACVAVHDGRAAITTGGAPLTALHEATGPLGRAWSSHAVAAAVLAGLAPEVDPEPVPELLAAGCVGGNRTLVRGVRAVGPAPAPEAWPAEDEALGLVLDELPRSLARRVSGRVVACGLTAGLDSRAAAAALRLAGVAFAAFTVGEEEAAAAQATAARLGVAHEVLAPAASPANDVRWTEGLSAVPRGAAGALGAGHVVVHGGGGETGRAFFWRALAEAWPAPTPAQLRARFRLDHLPGLDGDGRAHLRARADAWLRDAEATGAEGWRVLDVVYRDVRLRRGHRAYVAPGAAGLVLAFATPALQRALVALPQDARVAAAAHRSLLARVLPGEPLPAARAQRRGVPRAARRLAAAVRARRPPRRGAADPLGLPDDPVLLAALGEPALRAWRAGLAAGDPRLPAPAAHARAVAAFAEALRSLRV